MSRMRSQRRKLGELHNPTSDQYTMLMYIAAKSQQQMTLVVRQKPGRSQRDNTGLNDVDSTSTPTKRTTRTGLDE